MRSCINLKKYEIIESDDSNDAWRRHGSDIAGVSFGNEIRSTKLIRAFIMIAQVYQLP